MAVLLTDEFFDRLLDVVEWAESQRGYTYVPPLPRAGVEVLHARTTSGTADGNGHYPAVLTTYSAIDAAWTEYAQAVKLKVPNSETLVNNTRYPVRAAGRTSGGDELYTVLDTPAAGGISGITVEDDDSSPTYASITTLRFDQDDGFVLSNPGAGIAKVDFALATTSQPGAVGAGDQTWAGNKTFNDGMGAYWVSSATTGSFDAYTKVGKNAAASTSVFFHVSDSAGNNTIYSEAILFGSTTTAELLATHKAQNVSGAPYSVLKQRIEDALATLTWAYNDSNPGVSAETLGMKAGTGSSQPCFHCGGSDGQTFTLQYKDHAGTNKSVSVTGGVITTTPA